MGLVAGVDFQHQFDRRDAADGVRRELAEPQRNRANQFAVDVDRAAAHALGDIRARRLAAHLAQDDVLLGTPHIPGNPDDLHRYRLWLRALEYGPGGALHALLDFGEGHDLHQI